MSSTNHELLQQVKVFLDALSVSGDSNIEGLEKSWDEFYKMYDVIIRRFASSVGVGQNDIDECAQDVWAVLVERMVRFEISPERARFRTWLYTIVRNKAVDRVRKSLRDSNLSLNDSECLIPVPTTNSAENPAVVAMRNSDSQQVHKALKELQQTISWQNYQVFHLRKFEGMPVQDVAERMEMTPGAVRTCQHRVEKRFRQLVAKYVSMSNH